jgi:hypothetical protein
MDEVLLGIVFGDVAGRETQILQKDVCRHVVAVDVHIVVFSAATHYV